MIALRSGILRVHGRLGPGSRGDRKSRRSGDQLLTPNWDRYVALECGVFARYKLTTRYAQRTYDKPSFRDQWTCRRLVFGLTEESEGGVPGTGVTGTSLYRDAVCTLDGI